MRIKSVESKNYDKNDKTIAIALVVQFCMLITNHTLKEVLNIQVKGAREIVSVIFMIITGLFYIRAIPAVLKRIGNIFVIMYSGSIAMFLMSYLFFGINLKYLLEISFYYFFMCLPNFLYYIALKDKKVFLDMSINASYYQIALVFIFFITVRLRNNSLEYSYDMVYSYLSIVPIIILSYKVFNEFNFLDSLLIVLGGGIIFIIGARGPIVCIIIFIFFYILANSIVGKQRSKFILTLFLLFFIIIIIALNSNLILNFINNILIKRNIHSRTIYTLLNITEIDFSAGRTDIYKICLDAIRNNPLLGIGIGGDRELLGGTYPHNIILEMLMSFGILFGLIFIIFILFLTIKSIFSGNFINRSLSVMFMGIGFIQLFISGSYITSPNFWLYLSICFCSVFKIKGKTNNVQEHIN